MCKNSSHTQYNETWNILNVFYFSHATLQCLKVMKAFTGHHKILCSIANQRRIQNLVKHLICENSQRQSSIFHVWMNEIGLHKLTWKKLDLTFILVELFLRERLRANDLTHFRRTFPFYSTLCKCQKICGFLSGWWRHISFDWNGLTTSKTVQSLPWQHENR